MIACPECDAERSRQYESPCPKCGYIIHKEHDETDVTIGLWGFTWRAFAFSLIPAAWDILNWSDWFGYVALVIGLGYFVYDEWERRTRSRVHKRLNNAYLDELEQKLEELKKVKV